MPRIIRTPQANEDVTSISAADNLIRAIDNKLNLLARQPFIGSPMDDYRPGLRASFVGRYIIFYHPIDDGIEVYRVLHGARQLEDLL